MSANDPRSPTTSSSTPSPPSNGTRSSSSSSSSPPRSSASPPDELLQLKLEDDEGRELPEGRHQRTVPCAQCRSIRRVCRWVEGRKECERCLKRGLACSGPRRRGKAKLDPVTVDDESASILLEEELELVAIGPSSSTEGWNRTHMSYALTHHLVEAFIKLSHAMTFPGVDVADFQARFYWNRGRTSELSLNHELLSLVYMGMGAQLTDHTAILGAPSATPESEANMLGLVRRAPLLNIINQIGDRLEDDRRLELDTASAIDCLGLAWMALEQLHMPEHGLARHRLLGETIIQGMTLLERADCPESSREAVGMYLQGLAREELRQSLECDIPSALSPHQHHAIFGPPSTPLSLHTPDDTTLTVLFSAEKDSAPAAGELSGRFFGALEGMYDHLDYVLGYAPRDKLLPAASYVWRRLDELDTHYEREFRRVHDDPRFVDVPLAPEQTRPIYYLSTIAQMEMFQLSVLWGVHLALERAKASADLLKNSEERIATALSTITRRFALLPHTFPGNELGQYLTAIRLTITLDLVRERFLLPWSRENPAERELLIDGLAEASNRLPEAARLVQLLEGRAAATSLTNSP